MSSELSGMKGSRIKIMTNSRPSLHMSVCGPESELPTICAKSGAISQSHAKCKRQLFTLTREYIIGNDHMTAKNFGILTTIYSSCGLLCSVSLQQFAVALGLGSRLLGPQKYTLFSGCADLETVLPKHLFLTLVKSEQRIRALGRLFLPTSPLSSFFMI